MVTGQSGDYVPGTHAAVGRMGATGFGLMQSTRLHTGVEPLAPVRGTAVPGVDHVVDQVKRAEAVMRLNPGVLVTSPSQNGTGHYVADWTAGVSDTAPAGRTHAPGLQELLDHLTDDLGFRDAP